jgi:4-methyl-5(b-hydroxyethyl)-thiazole monophosphate biosynthesis
MNKKVYVFLADGFEEVEAISPVDVLRRANIETLMVSITNNLKVKGAHGIELIADGLFDDYKYDDADVLLLPGGMPGADNLNKHSDLLQLLKDQNAKGKQIAAICAAPYILGELGLLKTHKATCYPGYEKQLLGATYSSHNVVVSKNITTSKGAGTAMEFALELLAQLVNRETADTLSKKMMVN